MGLRIHQVGPVQTVAAVENSIAVMPFEVCGDLARDRNLASGLTREVISRLAERGRLYVKAYASSYAFAGFGLPTQEITRPLGVQYLVTGELCRDQGDISLVAEMSDEQGYVVWSDRFEQQVNQFEQVTQRLATLVASGIAVELGDVLPATPEAPVNRLAYEQLLIGVEHSDSGDEDNARAAFERALQYQPDLAEARYYLALFELKSFMSRDQGAGLENARPMVEEALNHAKHRLEQNDRNAQVQYLTGLISLRLTLIDEELLWRRVGKMNDQEITEYKQDLAEIEDLSKEKLLAADSSKVSFWALILAESEKYERAIELLETTRHARTLWTEDEAQDSLFLATLYQAVGRDEDAEPLIAGVVRHLEAEYASGIRHKTTLEMLAEAYALQGREDDVIDMLRKAFDYHSLTPCSWRQEFPAALAHIQEDPRYISLCERIDAERDQQSQRIRAMLSKYDVDELLAPQMVLVESGHP